MTRSTATHRTKEVPCQDCGKLLTVGKNTRKAQLCLPCGVQRQRDNNRQLHEKSGPYYEQWRESMKRATSTY